METKNKIYILLFLLLFPACVIADSDTGNLKITDLDGKTSVLTHSMITEKSTPLMKQAYSIHIENKQVKVQVKDLLAFNSKDNTRTLKAIGDRGESVEFDLDEVLAGKQSLYLVTAGKKGWKLVIDPSKGIGGGSFLLRRVAEFRILDKDHVKVTNAESTRNCANPKVYLNLADIKNSSEDICIVNLSGQNLETIPLEVLALKNIRELYLGRNNISKLPEDISRLKSLEKLILGRNKLTTLPKEIADLKNLKILKLGRNQISSLPKEIGQLKKVSLLELDNNDLAFIPDEVGQMTGLHELELAFNPIKTLPSTLTQLAKLEEVELVGSAVTATERKRINKMLPGVEIEWEE